MKIKHYTKAELKKLSIDELRDQEATMQDIYAKICFTEQEKKELEEEFYNRYLESKNYDRTIKTIAK